jgi:hypothetical protein
MLVVLLVAGITIHRGVFKAIVCMAVLAGDLNMLVSELVAGLVVVKPYLLPIPFRMTIRTGGSQSPFVRIVLLVAARAG